MNVTRARKHLPRQEAMRLENEVRTILFRNRDGSESTKAGREDMLLMCVEQLYKGGFKKNHDGSPIGIRDLKGRHINFLVKSWQKQGLAVGTIKNRMANLRWLAEKIGDKGLIKATNKQYGIDERQYITNENKSRDLAKLSEVDKSHLSEYVRLSLELQQAFGLRREESMKFQPSYALAGFSPDNAEQIRIKPSWAKGGRYREIPVTNDYQRDLLRQAVAMSKNCENGSLIPKQFYKTHLATFELETAKAGIGKTHGLRHHYAQQRYFQLTGWQCPAVSGIRALSEVEKEIDKQARQQVSRELGHERLSITGVYLGSWALK